MDLTHEFTVPASVDSTWDAFNDLERIAPCFPGATLTEVDGDDFTGSVKVKLGPISLVYNGIGTFVERDAQAHRAVIEAKGKDKRGNGTAAATVTAVLAPDGHGTKVTVSTDMAITGKPAQFGRGVIQDVSDKLLKQFVDCISAKLSPGASGTAPDAATSTSSASAASAGAASAGAATAGATSAGGSDAAPAQTSEPSSAPTPDPSAEPSTAGPSTTAPPSAGSPTTGSTGGASASSPAATGPSPSEESPSEESPSDQPRSEQPRSDRTGSTADSADEDDAADVNLLTTVGPVLVKRYGPALAGVVAAVVVLVAIIKRARRR